MLVSNDEEFCTYQVNTPIKFDSFCFCIVKYYSNLNRTFSFSRPQCFFKGTVMQIEKAPINDCLRFQKYAENFAYQLFITLH